MHFGSSRILDAGGDAATSSEPYLACTEYSGVYSTHTHTHTRT